MRKTGLLVIGIFFNAIHFCTGWAGECTQYGRENMLLIE
jgi:hypothetical protein